MPWIIHRYVEVYEKFHLGSLNREGIMNNSHEGTSTFSYEKVFNNKIQKRLENNTSLLN
jgi:hypothetical protein